MKFAHYDPEEFFDEMFARAGAPRAAAHALIQLIDTLPAGELAAPAAVGRARAAADGHHLQRLRRRRRHRADLPVRPRPAHRLGRRMADGSSAASSSASTR